MESSVLRTCNFLYKIVLDTQKLTFDFAYFCACSIAALFIMPFFSRRFSSEKSPTIAVASFFSFFFFVRLFTHRVCTTFLWTIHFYQKYSVLDFERIQRPLPWNAKPRRVFLPIFWRYETFPAPFSDFLRHFSNFFKVFKGSPLLFFGVLQLNGCWKSLKGPFYIFRHYETVKNSHFSFLLESFKKFFENFFMSQKSPPFEFFYILQ